MLFGPLGGKLLRTRSRTGEGVISSVPSDIKAIVLTPKPTNQCIHHSRKDIQSVVGQAYGYKLEWVRPQGDGRISVPPDM